MSSILGPLIRSSTLALCVGGGVLAAPGCKSAPSPPAARAATASPVDGPTARKLVAAGAILVDVRSPGEFAAGHLEGARNIPVGELSSRLGELPKDKPIVVYCAVGARSATAAGLLAEAGYDVRNLGKMAAWGP